MNFCEIFENICSLEQLSTDASVSQENKLWHLILEKKIAIIEFYINYIPCLTN